MKAKQFFFAGTHPAGVEPPREAVRVDDQLMRQLKARAAKLPIEGELASFAGATGGSISGRCRRLPCAARSFLSTSGRLRASTGCARFPTCVRGLRNTATRAWW